MQASTAGQWTGRTTPAVNDSDEIGRVGFHQIMGMLAGGELPKITPLYSGLVLKEEAAKRYDPNKAFQAKLLSCVDRRTLSVNTISARDILGQIFKVRQ